MSKTAVKHTLTCPVIVCGDDSSTAGQRVEDRVSPWSTTLPSGKLFHHQLWYVSFVFTTHSIVLNVVQAYIASMRTRKTVVCRT